MSITTRLATELDSEWILSELRAFSRFYGTDKPLFGDEEHAQSVLSDLINHHLVLLAESGKERLGFIAGYLTPHPYNPEISILHEAFWWVTEEHRGTRAGSMLLDAFLEHGKAKGVDWINFTLEHASPVNEQTLIRRGFRPIERQFLLEVS